MMRIWTSACVVGVFAASLSFGSVPRTSRALPGTLHPVAMSREAAPSQIRPAARQSASSPARPALHSRADEPVVVILYGSRPWSWM